MSEPEMTDEEARQRVLEAITKTSRRAAMIAFVRGEPSSPQGVDNNGTASLIELSCGKVLLTNCHVWTAFQEQKANDSSYTLALAGEGLAQPIDISDAS